MTCKRVLIVLNYYYPYISGVSEYARQEAEMLARNGHTVTVICSNHSNLPSVEIINGVQVYRAHILTKISKGTLSIQFILHTLRLARNADVVRMHCPMLEAGFLSLLIPKRKLVTMYHCDVNLSHSLFDRFIVAVLDLSHKICLWRSRDITVTTLDYASHSRVASRFISKTTEIATCIKEYYPVVSAPKRNLKRIGFCGRLVREKGLDILLEAYVYLKSKNQNLELYIAGDYKTVAGGSIYPKLADYIRKNNIKGVYFLGKLSEDDMPKFFSSLDVFVLPSINSLEAFGMVQLEAMRCGAPVVASDLYGVRTIVSRTKGGLIAKTGDASDLANCIDTILNNPSLYIKSISDIEKYYSNKIWAEKCLKILLEES